MMNALETKAMQSVCACWHYELANELDTMDAADLHKVIKDPFIFHRDNTEELNECPQYLQTKQKELIK